MGSTTHGIFLLQMTDKIVSAQIQPSMHGLEPDQFELTSSMTSWATVELLHQYRVNIKQVRQDLLLTIGAPKFPALEWDNILCSFAVNLNCVPKGLHSIANDDVEITELGPFTVSAPKQHSVKKVEDAGQWLFAWN